MRHRPDRASGESPVHIHSGPDERLLASHPGAKNQSQNRLQHHQRLLAVPGSSLWPPRCTGDFPAPNGHLPEAATPVRGRLLGRCCHPLLHLGRSPLSPQGSPQKPPVGWADDQPEEMPPGVNRGKVPGITHQPGAAEAAGKEAGGSEWVPLAHIKKAGMCLYGAVGVLQEICP